MSSLTGLVFLSIAAFANPDEKVEAANSKAASYHKLLLKRPGNPTVFTRFVNAWLDTGDKKGLRAWLEQKAKSQSVSDLRIMASFHEYLGEDELALSTLSKAVDKEPKNAELRLVRAKMLARTLSFDEALKDLALAAKDEKIGVEASKLQGIYLARSGQIEKAVAVWKDVIARFPKDEELREDLIELEVVEGLYEDAEKASTALIAMTKDPYVKVLRQMRLADIQILGAKREEGLTTYKKILDATGEGTWIEREVLARLEKVYLREDNVKGLRDLYQEIREKYPRRISIKKALAQQMAATGEMDEAIALFKEVLKITPGNLKNRQEFISFLEKNGKWAEAKTELKDLLKVRKDDVLLWQRLAQLEQHLENRPEVKNALDRVKELKKSTPEGIIVAANLYDQADLKEEAEALLREGSKEFADSDEVREALASFLIHHKKEKEAVAIWKEMAKAAPREVLLRVARSLSGHDKSAEAFALILGRVGEFKNDVLILAKLCSLVTNQEDAISALPHAMELVKQATTPTDLETYLRLAVRVIQTAEKEHDITNQLATKEAPTVAECCLLAELYSSKDDSIAAAKYLKKAEEIDQGLLAKFYRVHYNEQRGELENAVSIMEDIVKSPEGRKTVYMRRLVGLLQRDGKLDDALARIDEWKRMAPGDRAAWQKRADLLSLLGRPDESVTEIRRMIGKFGSEEGLRASLASGLLDVGDYRPAQKIYEQLYDEADSQKGKLKWVVELAQLAQQEGSTEELLQNFDRRGRMNPQSIEPLLAKAEVYRVLNQYDQRREMLIEAARRRPHDASLLIEISEVEERAGELDQAIASLREAVKLDKTEDSKSKLAKLLIASGEIEAGLSILAQVPSQASDPRQIEKTMDTLMKGGEWDAAISYLKKMPQHSEDWRLKYLQGVCLSQIGEDQKAFDHFVSLSKVSNELKGVKPLLTDKHFAQRRNSRYPTFKGWTQLSQYMNILRQEEYNFTNRQQYSRGYYGSRGVTTIVSLPGSLKEVSWMAILKAARIADKFPEEKKRATWNQLSVNGVDEIALFVMANMHRQQAKIQKDFQKEIEKRLKADPDNPILLTYWLSNLKEGSLPSKERILEVLAIIEKHNPLSTTIVTQQMLHLKLLTQDEVMEYMVGLYEKCQEDKKDEMMPYLMGSMNGKDLNESSQKVRNEIQAEALERLYAQAEEPKNSWWIAQFLNELLNQNKGAEAVRLMNQLCKWEAKRKPLKPGAAGGRYGYSSQQYYMRTHLSHRHGRGGTYLVAPSKFPQQVKGVHGMLLSMVSRSIQRTSSSVAIDAEQKKLLKQLGEVPKSKLSPSAVRNQAKTPAELLKALKGLTSDIENTALRAMILMVLDDEDVIRNLVRKLEVSQDANELLIAAGYYFDAEDGKVKAYQILEKIATLTNLSAATRKKIDGHLVFIGAELAVDESNKSDLNQAKRAALRIRKSVNTREKPQLIAMMNSLGLSDEVNRMVKSVKLRAPVSRSKVYRRPVRGEALCLVFIREEKTEDAVREAVREVRRLTKTGQNGSYQLKRFVGFLKKHQLVDATIKKMDPGEKGSFTRRLSYADFCSMLSQHEKARPIYKQLLKERPRSQEAYVGWMLSSSFEEIVKGMLVPDESGKIDYEKLYLLFSKMAQMADNDVDVTLNMYRIISDFLQKLKPSVSEDVNLSWINQLMISRVNDTYFQDYRFPPLLGNDSSSKADEKYIKKTTERDKLAEQLFVNMLKHPQTAEQGFILLRAAKTRLKITDENLVKYAQKAAVEMIRRPKISSNYSASQALWMRFGKNGAASGGSGPSDGISPVAYLAAKGLKTGGDLLAEDLLAAMQKHQPERYERIMLVKQLDKAEKKEAVKLFAQWRDKLPEERNARNQEVSGFVNTIIFINPKNKAWTSELQKLILSEKLQGYGGSNWSKIRSDWAKWITVSEGNDACGKYLDQLLVTSLAPKEKWPILAKLGRNRLPNDYQQRIYAVEALLTLMLAEPTLAGQAAHVIIDNDLTKVFSNTEYRIQQLWGVNHTSPEACIEWIYNSQLIKKRPKGSPFKASRLFFVFEGARRIRLKESKMKIPTAKLLLADKRFDPILAQVLAAHLMGPVGGRAVISKTIAANPKDFAAVMKSSRIRTHTLIRYWFPNLTTTENSKGASKYLNNLRKDLLAEAKSKAAIWKKGIKITSNQSNGSEYVPQILQLIEDDPYQAADLWLNMLKGVRKQSAVLAASSFSSSRSTLWHDSWNSYLFQSMFSRSGFKVSPINQIKFIHQLYRTEASSFLLEPSWNGNRYNSHYWSYLEEQAAKSKLPADQAYKKTGLALEAWAKQLTKDEQATMIVLIQQSLTERMRVSRNDSKKYQKWVAERYGDQSTPVANAMKSIVLMRIRKYEPTDATVRKTQLVEERAAFAKLLEHKGLSVAMRVELMNNVSDNQSSSRPLMQSEEIWKLMLKTLIEYKKGGRDTTRCAWHNIIARMVNLKFDGRKNVAGDIARESEALLQGLSASNSSKNITLTRNILVLGMEGGNKKIIQKYLATNANEFRGNINIMMELAKQGEVELAKRLIASGGVPYSLNGLGAHDGEFKKTSELLIAGIPQKSKYRLEIHLANCRDPVEPKPSITRADRIKALAARYKTETPSVRQARLEVLAILSAYPEAANIVAEQLREESARRSLGKIILTRRDSQGQLEGAKLKVIINRVNQMDLKDQSYDGIAAQLKSLRMLAGTDEAYQASYSARELLKLISHHMMQRISQHPDQAKHLLPLAAEVVKICTALGNNSGLIKYGISASMLVHCVADEADKYEALIKSRPELEQKTYQKYLKSYNFPDRIRYLVNVEWKAKENQANRRRLLTSLFKSKWFCHEQIVHVIDLSRLIDRGFMTLQDVMSVLETMPENQSRRAEFLCEKAGITAWRLNKVEEADKVYAQAIEIAKAQKNEKVTHLVLAYRSIMLGGKSKLARSKKWGQQVNRELLSKADLQKFDKVKKRWPKTSNK